MEPYERLRKARIDAGFKSPKEASDYHNWNEHTYKSHENGNRGIRLNSAQKYSSAFKVSAGWLMTGGGSKQELSTELMAIPIQGEAYGGVWREGPDTPMDTPPKFLIPIDMRFAPSTQYARKVVGDSVSNRIRNGEYVICVHYDSYPGGPKDGDLVDVERTRSGAREHTIKVLRIIDGKQILQTDSAEGANGNLDFSHSDDDTEVKIVGIAIGAHRQL